MTIDASGNQAGDAATERGRPVVVVGCPRSGTVFTSRVLRRNGFDVRHERMVPSGTVDAMSVIRRLPDDALVLHQVRHPLSAIRSMQTLTLGTLRRLARANAVLASDIEKRRLEVCARIWLFHNAQCAALALATFQVESDDDWNRACDFVGLRRMSRVGVHTTTNTRRQKQEFKNIYAKNLTIDELHCAAGSLVAAAIVRQAVSFGYPISDF
ncbi:MAG: hypothetical protein QM775_09535 [Pirellulales bacterium]